MYLRRIFDKYSPTETAGTIRTASSLECAVCRVNSTLVLNLANQTVGLFDTGPVLGCFTPRSQIHSDNPQRRTLGPSERVVSA